MMADQVNLNDFYNAALVGAISLFCIAFMLTFCWLELVNIHANLKRIADRLDDDKPAEIQGAGLAGIPADDKDQADQPPASPREPEQHRRIEGSQGCQLRSGPLLNDRSDRVTKCASGREADGQDLRWSPGHRDGHLPSWPLGPRLPNRE